VSHAEPWPIRAHRWKVLQWLGKEDAPALLRTAQTCANGCWGLQFLRECTPARTRHNIEQIVRLGTHSRDTLQQLRRDTGIGYDQRTQGILHFYTTQKDSTPPASPRRADARTGLRPAGDFGRRSREDRACTGAHPPPTGRRRTRPRTSPAMPTASHANS
jgi:hypothetical protein